MIAYTSGSAASSCTSASGKTGAMAPATLGSMVSAGDGGGRRGGLAAAERRKKGCSRRADEKGALAGAPDRRVTMLCGDKQLGQCTAARPAGAGARSRRWRCLLDGDNPFRPPPRPWAAPGPPGAAVEPHLHARPTRAPFQGGNSPGRTPFLGAKLCPTSFPPLFPICRRPARRSAVVRSCQPAGALRGPPRGRRGARSALTAPFLLCSTRPGARRSLPHALCPPAAPLTSCTCRRRLVMVAAAGSCRSCAALSAPPPPPFTPPRRELRRSSSPADRPPPVCPRATAVAPPLARP